MPFHRAVAEQYAHVDDNLAEIREMHITTLGDIPLVVRSAGKMELPEGYGLTAEDIADLQAVQSEMHAELAALSPQGEVVVAEESTHYIHFDQPELVIEAINHALDAQQGMDSSAPPVDKAHGTLGLLRRGRWAHLGGARPPVRLTPLSNHGTMTPDTQKGETIST